MASILILSLHESTFPNSKNQLLLKPSQMAVVAYSKRRGQGVVLFFSPYKGTMTWRFG